MPNKPSHQRASDIFICDILGIHLTSPNHKKPVWIFKFFISWEEVLCTLGGGSVHTLAVSRGAFAPKKVCDEVSNVKNLRCTFFRVFRARRCGM